MNCHSFEGLAQESLLLALNLQYQMSRYMSTGSVNGHGSGGLAPTAGETGFVGLPWNHQSEAGNSFIS